MKYINTLYLLKMKTTLQSDKPTINEEIFIQPNDLSYRLNKKPIYMQNIWTYKKMPDRPTRMIDDAFDQRITHSIETIKNFVKPLIVELEDKTYLEQEMLINIYSIIHIMETINRSDTCYLMIVKTTFMQFKYFCRMLTFLQNNPAFLLFIKALFHRYIVVLGHKELIEIYDEIFTDKLYANELATYVFVPVLTEEWKSEKIKEYQQLLRQIYARKNAKKNAPKYEIEEIIGARDKEGRWWMSKVLAIFNYQNSIVYYIEFIGWGERFNEFISDGFRIQKFNPKNIDIFGQHGCLKNLSNLQFGRIVMKIYGLIICSLILQM